MSGAAACLGAHYKNDDITNKIMQHLNSRFPDCPPMVGKVACCLSDCCFLLQPEQVLASRWDQDELSRGAVSKIVMLDEQR